MKRQEINFSAMEKKWQKEWEKKKVFEAKEGKGKKYYVLEMYPYPSATGLHIGHAFNYVIGDIYARFKIMQGYNVLHPMGFDSLGLPAENAAIKEGANPKKYTEKAIKNFIIQQKALGLSYDWTRKVETHNPDYYKWDQWIFLQMLKKKIAFRKKASVNFCEKCKTVLANEQVHDGKCWRHKDTEVQIKPLEQWFFKITKYADELYEGIKKLKQWPEDIKAMQENWIGKSFGTEINFEINNETWKIFTTRPDTIFGVTFMVVSAQHPRLMELVTKKQKPEVEKFLRKFRSVSQKSMKDTEEMDKEGVFTGSYAVNPANKEKIPVYAGNFVVADYGSGMVMAVPAHDQRDFEFAEKYRLPIREVIKNNESSAREKAYTGEGKLVNSGKFNNMNSKKAADEISKWLEKKKLGKRTTEFRLKDWLVSRQRYWGTPIPIVYCNKCGIVPVPEKDLPVKLPEKVEFGKGNPLKTAESWISVKCPKCNGEARRETDTMDTFVNSSWYFLRYCDANNSERIFDSKKAEYWMPIDVYIGGKEHACMHLIYFRFYFKFLRDLGLIKKIDEPAVRLFNQGMVHGADGLVMSKSRGNVIDPMSIIKKYSADILRYYLVSNAGADKDFAWSDKAIEGSFRFVRKVYDYYCNLKFGTSSRLSESRFNSAIKEITENIGDFQYNLAIIKLRELFESFEKKESREVAGGWLKMFSLFCPHISEELWKKLGNKNFICKEKWPAVNLKKIDKKLEEREKSVDRLIKDIRNILNILKQKKKKSKSVKIFAIPDEVNWYAKSKEKIEKSVNLKASVLSIREAKKAGKTIKSKPGKPGILIE